MIDILTLSGHGKRDVVGYFRKDVLLNHVLHDRHLGVGLALLPEVGQPRVQDVRRLKQRIDFVAAVLDFNGSVFPAALRSPLGSKLLRHLGDDCGGSLIVSVGVHLGEGLRILESVVDALGKDFELIALGHGSGKFCVQLGYVDRCGRGIGECAGVIPGQGLGGEKVVLCGRVDCKGPLGRGSGGGGLGIAFGFCGKSCHGILKGLLFSLERGDFCILCGGSLDHLVEDGGFCILVGVRCHECVEEGLSEGCLDFLLLVLG